MITTRTIIQQWLNSKKDQEFSHMIVVCDNFSHEDFPVYVPKGKDPREFFSKEFPQKEGTTCYRAMECYSYALDLESQLDETRANHWEIS